MSVPDAAKSFRLEVAGAHLLAMQYGARTEQFLDRAGAPLRDPRAADESLRMATLTSRLMEAVRRSVTLAQSGRGPTIAPADVGRPAAGPGGPAPTMAMPKLHAAPDSRRGRLKNGNPCGDYLRAPRCGARTRAGCPCRQPAMPNGRCRLHGGLSTGPRTAEGRRRSQTARLVHGYRSADLIGLRTRAVHAARRLRALTTTPRPAGHGVHRPESNFVGATGRSPIHPPHRSAGDLPVAPTSTGRTAASAGHGVDRSNPISR